MSNEERKPTVEELFKAVAPELAKMLTMPGHFWSRVNDNSIPSWELEADLRVNPRVDSAVRNAALILLGLRGEKVLPTPTDEKSK